MDVVKNILGRDDTDEEIRLLKQDLEYFKSIGDKTKMMKTQEMLREHERAIRIQEKLGSIWEWTL